MRYVGLDLGRRRIGVAVSDNAGSMAVPHDVFERSGDDEADRARLAALVGELGAETVVIGLPVSLDGSEGPAAGEVRTEAEALAALLEVPVALHDERLTTVVAERSLQAAGVRGTARKRAAVDQVAAAVILQSYLDSRS